MLTVSPLQPLPSTGTATLQSPCCRIPTPGIRHSRPLKATQSFPITLRPCRRRRRRKKKKKGKKNKARPGTFRDPAGHWIEKKAATYSPTMRSTIGAAGLNCSVRDGKRWDPRAMAASMTDKPRQRQNNKKGNALRDVPRRKKGGPKEASGD